MKSSIDFLAWERLAECVDFKPIYVDVAGDLIAGLLLSQIMYWNLPTKKNKNKFHLIENGQGVIVKSRSEWWEEIRISEKQYDRAIKILKEKEIVSVDNRKSKFHNYSVVPHIKLNNDIFIKLLNEEINKNVIFPEKIDSLPEKELTSFPDLTITLPERSIPIVTETTETTAEIKEKEENKESISNELFQSTLSASKRMELNFKTRDIFELFTRLNIEIYKENKNDIERKLKHKDEYYYFADILHLFDENLQDIERYMKIFSQDKYYGIDGQRIPLTPSKFFKAIPNLQTNKNNNHPNDLNQKKSSGIKIDDDNLTDEEYRIARKRLEEEYIKEKKQRDLKIKNYLILRKNRKNGNRESDRN